MTETLYTIPLLVQLAVTNTLSGSESVTTSFPAQEAKRMLYGTESDVSPLTAITPLSAYGRTFEANETGKQYEESGPSVTGQVPPDGADAPVNVIDRPHGAVFLMQIVVSYVAPHATESTF